MLSTPSPLNRIRKKAAMMKKLRLQPNGPLCGDIPVSGAKNAALPLLCASLLTAETMQLSNVPLLDDIITMQHLLEGMGSHIATDKAQTFNITNNAIHHMVAPYDLVKTMRASILVLGPLLARFGEASVSLPGGCAIGSRPVDQHIKGLSAMGAKIKIEHGYIYAQSSGLKGTHIIMDVVTVTGTENLLMAATLAKGETILDNAAREPEVVDLANCLNAMGAKITGMGTGRITIQGVKQLHGIAYWVMPDRIEAGTFLAAGAITLGNITLQQVNPAHMQAILEKLTQAGALIKKGDNWISLEMKNRPRAVSIGTAPYPNFPTDMQAQFMALNTIAQGTAKMTETIFENRFMHVSELNRMGANIETNANVAFVHGVARLSGSRVIATDLRASASLVIAGLVAEGETVIDRIYHLDRGYAQIEQKLNAVGANIQRID